MVCLERLLIDQNTSIPFTKLGYQLKHTLPACTQTFAR